MIVSGSRDQVAMIEGFAQEMPEDEMMEAIQYAHQVIREVIDLQEELYRKVNPTKKEFVPPEDDGLFQRLHDSYYNEFKTVSQTPGKHDRADAVRALRDRAMADVIPDPNAEGAVCPKRFGSVWHDLEEKVVHIFKGAQSCCSFSVTVSEPHLAPVSIFLPHLLIEGQFVDIEKEASGYCSLCVNF